MLGKNVILLAANKLAYEIKFLLGRIDTHSIRNDEILLNGQNVFEYYLKLYSGVDKDKFRGIIKDAVILLRSERIFRKYIYPAIYGSNRGFNGNPPILNKDELEGTAREVGRIFLGKDHFEQVKEWLSDDDSKQLFNLEILQKALKAAGWHQDFASDAVSLLSG